MAEDWSPWQELEEGLRSGPYLLVMNKHKSVSDLVAQ